MGENEERNRNKRNKQPEESDDEEEETERMQTYMTDEANEAVRNKYDRLMSVIHTHKDEEKRMDMHDLQLLVLEANEAFIDVKRPREAALDAQLLRVCGNLAKHSIESSNSNLVEFNPTKFAERLISFAMNEEEGETEVDPQASILERFSKKLPPNFHPIPGIQPLFCAIEGEKPIVKKTRRKKEKGDGVQQKMKKVAALKENQGEEEADALARMNKTLKHCFAGAGNKPLSFFEFAVDPTSFSKTVENLFHISLLIREKYAELIEEENGLPYIRPRATTRSDEGRMEGKQSIISMDMEEWEAIVKTFNIKTAMIPSNAQDRHSKKKK